MRRLAALAFVLVLLPALPLRADPPTLEEGLADFLRQTDPQARLLEGLDLVAKKPSPPAVAAALPQAWTWSEEAPKGEIVTWERETADGVTHTIFAYVPESYTPEKAWPVLIWLHGGVGRDEDGAGEGGVRMFGDEAGERGFLILSPSTQNGARWWTPNGTALIRGALKDLGRRWHVDADRVCVAGFSDGGSGCYHLLAHDPEPYACFVAFMGNPLVSRSAGGPTWAPNLASRPVYAVNGGEDRLYPSAMIRPFLEEMEEAGCDLAWIDEPDVGHELSFLAERWEEAYDFWMDHSREASPKRLAWVTSRLEGEGRLSWVEILRLDADAPASEDLVVPVELSLPEVRRARLGFRIDTSHSGPGILVEEVEEDTPAAEAGLEAGDVILQAGDTPIADASEIGRLREYLDTLEGEEGAFLVKRGEDETTMHMTPRILEKDRPARPAALGYDIQPGMVVAEIVEGNAIDVRTCGVGALRLWLSPTLVDFGEVLTVRVNGREVVSAKPTWDVACMLAQAVANGPGAPVYAAHLDIEVPRE